MSDVTNHVPTLETCQKLKEAGFPQETIFSRWSNLTLHNGNPDFADLVESTRGGGFDWDWECICAAPILTEILEQLPKEIPAKIIRVQCPLFVEFGGHQLYIGYAVGQSPELVTNHKNPAEAAALLWFELNKR